jgi:hypothetical protein
LSGHYRMHRDWMDNPIFADEKFSKAQAWMWLIERAAWKATRVAVSGSWLDLKRGQLTCSVRYLEKIWKWPRTTISRFISRLKKENMIGTEIWGGQMLVTICKYDTYQASPHDAENTERDSDGTEAGHLRDASGTNKKEDNEVKKEESKSLNPTDASKTYFFDASVVKLNRADYDGWKTRFFTFPDFDAELYRVDDALRDKKPKNWFSAASAMLNAKHQANLAAQKPPPKVGTGYDPDRDPFLRGLNL